MAAAAVLVTAARRSAAGQHDFDEVPLYGVFAKGLKLSKQFYDCPRRHMPSRLMETNHSVKCYFVFFCFLLLYPSRTPEIAARLAPDR